jgi:hypothetical protein
MRIDSIAVQSGLGERGTIRKLAGDAADDGQKKSPAKLAGLPLQATTPSTAPNRSNDQKVQYFPY